MKFYWLLRCKWFGVLGMFFLLNLYSVDVFSKVEAKPKPKPMQTVDAEADLQLWKMCMKSYEVLCPIAKYKVALKQAKCVKEKIKKLPVKCQKRFAEGYNMVMSSLQEGEKRWRERDKKEAKEKAKDDKSLAVSQSFTDKKDQEKIGNEKKDLDKPIQYVEEDQGGSDTSRWGRIIIIVALLLMGAFAAKVYYDKRKKKQGPS